MNSRRHDEHPGFLFVLEGIDGAGKTAVVESLVELLSRNYDVVRLREPTNESQWGLEIRERSPKGELTPDEELNLFHLDRQWHVENRIRPALEAGKLVLMDRYFFRFRCLPECQHWHPMEGNSSQEPRGDWRTGT